MTKKNKLLLLALAVILVIALCLGVASCSGGKDPGPDEGPTAPIVGTEKRTYTVVLKTGGGKALEDIGVYFYTDSTMAELVWFAKTDAEGQVSFTDLESTGYVAVLDKVPEGYKVESYYPLTGETTEIVLETDMTDGDLENLSYKLGDVMMNFSVTDVEGNTWVLSDLLAEKKAVVLNFWYVQCAPCKAEFPYLQEAYEKYSDKIALLAMNPINDDNAEIKAFAEELGLTFPMAHCDYNWEKAMQLTAYPTTVIIDRFGTIALIHKGSIDETKVFEDAFEFFTADDYEQTTVENILDLEIKAQGSDSSDPIEIGSKTSFDVTLDPGQTVYYHIYRVDGMTLTVASKNISAQYNKTNYGSGYGLNFTVHCPDTYTPAAVSFTNDGEETETFTVRLAAKPGTVDNPHTLKLGDFSVSVNKGNEQGVYHNYTPKQDGILTVQCTSISPKGVEYGISLTTQKGSATVQRNLGEDGDAETGTVSIPVKKGVKVQIVVSTLPDDTKSYPAAKLKCTLSIGEDTSEEEVVIEKIKYAVTVTDQDMIPIPGVFMNFTKVGGTSTEEIPQQKTGEAGAAGLELEKGTYDVVLSLPVGYSGDTTQFQLTPDRPYASIKLKQAVVEMKNYSVSVTNAEGKPIPNVTVTIGTGFARTDAFGKVTFELPESDYKAIVVAPKGYTAVSEGYAFPEGSTDLTVILEKKTSEDGPTGETETYTVNVVDYSGKAQSGVMVTIMQDEVFVDAQQTDSSGTITTELEAADYTVSLAFSGTKLYYEEKLAVLPVGTTELTIKVAPGVSGEPEDLYVGAAYYLHVGGNYVEMQANTTNYYIFEPDKAGQYRFSTSDPEAILSYWGASTIGYIGNMTSGTDYDPETNSFTMNIKEGNLAQGDDGGVIVLVGVTGAPDCIIEVTRIGGPILDETDIPYEVYELEETPKQFTISDSDGKKLKYVDVEGDTKDYSIEVQDGICYLKTSKGLKQLYVNLGPDAPYQCLYYLAGYGPQGMSGNGIKATLYDESGNVEKKYDFSKCVEDYYTCSDKTYHVYPLTEDLQFILQTAAEANKWSENEFWFGALDDLNPELVWMFAVCYVP